MFGPLVVLVLAAPARPAHVVDAEVRLPDGRDVPAIVDTSTLQDGGPAARISPRLGDGRFWSFGDAFQRAVFYDCGDGVAPRLETQNAPTRLSCANGAPRLRPNITWPADASAHPNSDVPPVRPGGRPVSQGLHFLLGWALPCGVLLLLFVLGSLGARTLAKRAPTGPVAPRAPPLGRKDRAWMWGLTLVGLAIRLINIGDEPFEQNEFTYYMSGFGHDSPLGVLLDVNAMAQTHPPLPHLLLWLIEPLGNDEIWARVPQALFGAATLPLVFKITWNTTDGHLPAAITATAAAAIASVHVWYSQDVSPYTITTFFAALTLLGGQGALRDPDDRRAWWQWILGGWGLVYTHYYGLHLSFGIVLASVLLSARRTPGSARRLWRTISAGCTLWIGIVPWIPAFIQAYLWSRGHSTAYQRTALVYHPTQDLARDLLDLVRLVGGYPVWLAWLAPVGLVIGAMHVPFRDRALRDRLLLAVPLAWFIPFELFNRATFLKGLYDGYYFGVRYFLFLFPVAWVLCGWCIAAAQRPARPLWLKWATYATAALSLVASAGESIRHLTVKQKPDVLSAARLVKSNLMDGDAVLVGPAAFYHHPFHYYFADPPVRSRLGINALMSTPAWQPVLGSAPPAGPTRPMWLGVLSDLFEPYERSLANTHIQRVWVVDHTQHLLDRPEFSARPSAVINRAVSAHFEQVWSREFHDCSVRLFERRSNAVETPESLHFGWSDGAFVRAMEPPWAYVAPGRRLRLGSQLRLPHTPRRPIQSLKIRLGSAPPGGHQVRDEGPARATTVRIMGGQQLLASIPLGDTFETVNVPIPIALQHRDLVLTFDRNAPQGGSRPSEIILDHLAVERVPERKP